MQICRNLKPSFHKPPASRLSRTLIPVSKRIPHRQRRSMEAPGGLRIAVEGCCHGELDTIYAALQKLEEQEQIKIDLLICCGDFQAVRNIHDLECMAVPDKYKRLMTFYKYYIGELEAPYPTLFIGGNHEAINHLRELYYGGWVAPKMYFLGYSGVVNFAGLRIAGMSGIYNQKHYHLGHFEKLPYSEGTKRSAYHVRAFEVFKLLQIKEKVDVLLTHDWPHQVYEWGDQQNLVRRKPFFKQDIQNGCLGSPAATQLLQAIQPDYHFSAHLHTKFPAIVQHANGEVTRFLALDKCLPKRDYLQILEIPSVKGPKEFRYDPEWLAILKSTSDLMSVGQLQPHLPHDGQFPMEEDRAMIDQLFKDRGGLKIPENFVPTVKGANQEDSKKRGIMPRDDIMNPQTVEFLEMLDISYNLYYGDPSHSKATEELFKLDEARRPEGSTFIDLDVEDDEGEEEDLKDE